ncbi:MAG: DinB family protein [Candidatus Tectomicrobia bacterium]|uniref:DinB family protein n=1 Tax=Tectimicrobiota bacterium TaxID=2528274 RepID=A0A932HZ74_UNCTE|nr:DinB family protein [Candidatus Tectomicrobia bacterium]
MYTAPDVVAKTLELNSNLVRMALEGLSDEEFLQQPKADCNPIAWLLWHMTRVEDSILSRFSGEPQVWIEGGWHERIQAPGGAEDAGMGNKMEQVCAFRAGKEDLLAYAEAVRQNTQDILPAISTEMLTAKVENPPSPAVQRQGDFLSILLTDYSHHAGQICYLRGYIKGAGWLPF